MKAEKGARINPNSSRIDLSLILTQFFNFGSNLTCTPRTQPDPLPKLF